MLGSIPQAEFYAAPPTESELEYGQLAKKYDKLAKLSSYNVRIFDMSNTEHVSEYEKLMKELFEGIQTKRCVIWAKDRSLIDGTWKIYMEWSTYSMSSDKDKSENTEGTEDNE